MGSTGNVTKSKDIFLTKTLCEALEGEHQAVSGLHPVKPGRVHTPVSHECSLALPAFSSTGLGLRVLRGIFHKNQLLGLAGLAQ